MDFQSIFEEYYTLFRGDSAVPPTTDPEWAIAVRYGNAALRRLEQVENEKWSWLWTTAVAEGESTTYTASSTIPTVTTYDGPSTMLEPGGFINLVSPDGKQSFKIDVIEPYQVQLQSGSAPYAFWTGGAQQGWTLHINLTGNSYTGWTIDYPYYKQITTFNATTDAAGNVAEDGNTVTECPDPSFIINYILAYRLRSTRNYPSYQTAKADAETCLEGMQLKNRSGVDGHSWNLNDTSSGSFGTSGFGV